MVEGHRCLQAWRGHAKIYLERGNINTYYGVVCHLFSLWLCSLRKGMEDYQSLLVLHGGIKWTLSFRVGIPGVTIPKRGFGDNELMLS